MKYETGDKTKSPLVENPYGHLLSIELKIFGEKAKEFFAGGKQGNFADICPVVFKDKGFLNDEELKMLSEQPDYESYLEQGETLFRGKFGPDFVEIVSGGLKKDYPDMRLYEAIKLAEEIKAKYGGIS